MEEQKLLKRKEKALIEGNNNIIISACTDLAEIYMERCQYNNAIKEYKLIAETYQAQGCNLDYARANRGLGEAYMGLCDFETAIIHQTTYLDISKQEKDKLEEQRALATLGHTYLTRYLNEGEEMQKELLNSAYKYFMKSLMVCESLTGISKWEKADMSARLFSNLGVVHESLKNYDKSEELLIKSINICKAHDIYEQLQRAHSFLASLYEKKGEFNNAIHQYNLAIETSKKLKNKHSLMCTALSSKAEMLIKLSDLQGAKNSLFKAYKMKSPNVEERALIERNLKIVVALCQTQDKLLVTSDTNYKELRTLYELMGDGSCHFKNYKKAIEYYQKMLTAAKNAGDSNESLAPCYFSLAETYRDNKEYKEAIKYYEKEYNICKNNLKESLNSLLKISECIEASGGSMDEVRIIFDRALKSCKEVGDKVEEGRILTRYITYLRNKNNNKDAFPLEKRLSETGYIPSESDTDDDSQPQNTSNLGDDVSLSNITDVSDDSEVEEVGTKKPIRRRSKNYVVKRNVKGETPLHTACITGKMTVVRHLLEQGHPVNVRDHCGWLPLHEACICGHSEIVSLLLEKGAAINDRGGTHCNGMTPLHDAASNGHLNVIELLLDKGASPIAKTDDGETPLHLLKKWFLTVQLEYEEKLMYENITRRMTLVLERSGQTANDILTQTECNTQKRQNILSLSNSQSKRPKSIQIKNLRRSIPELDIEEIPSVSKPTSRNKFSSESDSSNSDSSESDKSTCATDEYREVMNVLRNKNSKQKENRQYKRNKCPALLSNDDVIDDWLEDDLKSNKTNKRLKTSANSYINSSNVQRNGAEKSPTPKKSTQESISPVSNLSNRSFSRTPTFSSPSKSIDSPVKIDTFLDTMVHGNKLNHKSQVSLLQVGFSRNNVSNNSLSNISPSYGQKHHKRNHQVKLTQFAHVRNVAEADSTTESQLTNKNSLMRNSSIDLTLPSSQQELVSQDPMLSVDVRIEGRLFRVPVLRSQIHTHTIQWLANEAANRYLKKEYTRPELELETKNGAVLANEDFLSLLFIPGTMQAEEVQGRVLEWNIPSISVRYKEACTCLNVDPVELLVQKLECLSVDLNLEYAALRGNTLAPLFRSLNRQTSLLELNLSGNFITVECIKLLAITLLSLENLTCLNLNCCGLTVEHMQYLSNTISTSSNEVLPNLFNLDLSDNYIGDAGFKHFSTVLNKLHLQVLNISNCKLTSDIFGTSYNTHLNLNLLEVLILHDNELNTLAISKLLESIQPNKIRHLDVSRNGQHTGLLRNIINFLSSNINLKTLNLSRGSVNDSEVYDLISFPGFLLEDLNLSYNKEITGITLRRLLQTKSLQTINVTGCENILKYFDTSFMDNLNSKLTSLKLRIDSLLEHELYEMFVKFWTDLHHEKAVIINSAYFLSLSVAE